MSIKHERNALFMRIFHGSFFLKLFTHGKLGHRVRFHFTGKLFLGFNLHTGFNHFRSNLFVQNAFQHHFLHFIRHLRIICHYFYIVQMSIHAFLFAWLVTGNQKYKKQGGCKEPPNEGKKSVNIHLLTLYSHLFFAQPQPSFSGLGSNPCFYLSTQLLFQSI